MKKFLLAAFVIVTCLLIVTLVNGGNNKGVYKDINQGITIEPNDNPGPGAYVNNLDYEDKDARDEALYRLEYTRRLYNEPEELAKFLLSMGELTEYMPVDPEEDSSTTIEKAVALFAKDEDIHQKALKRAEEVFSEVHIDCNWAELRKIAPRSDDFETYEEYRAFISHPVSVPIVINTETGEQIIVNAGPWSGPTD